MVLCEWCGDENVTPQDNYYAELCDGKPMVWRIFTCNICQLDFMINLDDERMKYGKEHTVDR